MVDPVEMDILYFELFWGWIEKRLKEEKRFNYYNNLLQLKSLLNMSISLMGILTLINFFYKKREFVLWFIKEKLFGDDLPYRLSVEWVMYSKTLEK
jgi:hypothetical protein